jgi:hypothetical protein
VHTHRPAGGRHLAQLLGQGEQTQAESDQHVMLRHTALLELGCVVVTPSLSERADAPAAAGAANIKSALKDQRVSQALGVSPF